MTPMIDKDDIKSRKRNKTTVKNDNNNHNSRPIYRQRKNKTLKPNGRLY